jgi:hypothetical protein
MCNDPKVQQLTTNFRINIEIKPFGLEFEMSVDQICKFDPFWTDLIQENPKIKWPFLFFLKI